MIVIDTNVLSELLKPEPDRNVVLWMGQQSNTSLFTTTITQAETLYGIALLPAGKRKIRLTEEIQAMFAEEFKGRILPFDIGAAGAYADIASSRQATGRPVSQFDAQIAGITRTRGGRLATRNVSDFSDCGIEIINPWLK